MKRILLITTIALMFLPLFSQPCGSCTKGQATKPAYTAPTARQIIVAPRRAHWISNDYYITYEWNKKPKIGHFILLVRAFDKDKKPVTNLDFTADAYMPSMKGAHDTGDVKMQLNKKNQYAVPVHFMMLGDWEIHLKVTLNGKQVGSAFIKLDI